MNNFILALSKSTLLHIALGALLVVSMSFTPHPEPKQELSAPVIEAVSVDKAALEQQIKQIQAEKDKQKQAEEKRIKDLERRANEARNKRREEEKQISNLNKQKTQAAKEAEAAKRKQKEEAERAQKLEEQRKQKEAEKKKAEQEAKAAAEKRKKEEQALKEQETKRQQAEARAEQERMMEEQLRAEQAARMKSRQKQVLSEVGKYQALIRSAITRNLIVDEQTRTKECRLNLKLASNGLVMSVKVLSGDPVLCRSAEAAVYKNATLPISSDPEVYQQLKDINLTIDPDRE
ncbi:cell envelope integrity protein TolA [Paraneptunicella aestuarii]|uniref:cell envelope integrity protein TolA n=1 Tax=Paraneptunicella aestuarii TaxID=2831148 RepID=UPI001E5DA822|nr:cell envelope integrity protein TolA [Paraneptunicella aestuarii]UAA37320.1 cell envelope integrity protein TolA [Paraneptunicella aestuarii]